jgi:heterodisulfide reductase subunit A
MPDETVKLTIDGNEIEVEPDIYILEAAERLGIWIPTLCNYRGLTPYGACRMCTVEVTEGSRVRLLTACSHKVSNGLIVKTDTERVRTARRILVELLCARHGRVGIVKQLAQNVGVTKPRFGEGDEACILCGLCVRACAEMAKAFAIGFAQRGTDKIVTTPYDQESEACINCGACAKVCPTGAIYIEGADQIRHDEIMLGPNSAIAVPTMQAVPNVPALDPELCLHFRRDGCGICAPNCPADAIDYSKQDEEVEVEAGTIVVATGFQVFDPTIAEQYGYGRFPNVLTSLEFERLSNAAGPTGGKIVLRDGRPPESVAIIHCVGSRDEHYHRYCSRVCCMYSLKFSHLVREKLGARVYQLYIDMRSFGKGYEEFYDRLLSEGALFIRGKGAEVTDFAISDAEKGKLVVKCEDTLAGVQRRLPVDMVILSVALEARSDARQVERMFNLCASEDGFFLEQHPKLAPVETTADGVFLAGCCQSPKDIPDTVAQGSAAAAQALSLILRGETTLSGAYAEINPDLCSGCRVCNELCPYTAISYNAEKKVSEVNPSLCKACGTCVAACPSGAIKGKHFTKEQILAEIEGVLQ